MTGVLGGFATLGVVIGLGWLVGRTGLLGSQAPGMLSRLCFYVATPTLLFLTLAGADTTTVLSLALVSTAGSAVAVAVLYVALARWRWRLRLPDLASGALAASYVNGGNLGIPVSVYVLGDASYVAPVLLFQGLVMAPVGLAVLAGSRPGSGAPDWGRIATQPLRTPIVVGCTLGLLVAATGTDLPPRCSRRWSWWPDSPCPRPWWPTG